MIKKFFKIVFLLIALSGSKPAIAQAVDPVFLDPKVDIEVLLPRFDSLYQIAMINNATQKQEHAAMLSAMWNERYTRWLWAGNLSVFYNYSFGNLPFFAYADQSQPTGLTQIKEGYRAGFNVQISVFDVMGHRGRVNEAKEKIRLAKFKQEAEAQELRRKLGQFYADMVGYNRLYKGRNEDLITQTVACGVAEKEWREGTIHIAEYARQKNVMADAEAAYQESFRFYYSSILQFESVLGVPLVSLIRRKK
jgi:hypothetical protein